MEEKGNEKGRMDEFKLPSQEEDVDDWQSLLSPT